MHRGSAAREDARARAGLVERHLYVSGPGGRRQLALGPGRQLALVLGLFAAAALIAFALVGQWLALERLAAKDRELAEVVAAKEARLSEARATEAGLRGTVGELEQALYEQRTTTRRLQDLHHALDAELERARARLAEAREERDAALDLARILSDGMHDAEQWLRSTVREKAGLDARLREAEARIETLVEEREQARRVESGLRWRVEVLETRLERAERAREAQFAWFRTWVGDHVGAIETLLADNDIDVDTLLARAVEERGYGQGGPFEALPGGELEGVVPARLELELENDLARMVAMQRLLAALPLAVPLDEYYVTSEYGPRQDPITRRQAYHAGIDFGAPAGTTIHAAAPGEVTHAGRSGPYGIKVDIDHGMGIVTRYAHLREATVEEGEWVGYRDEIGIIGSTGRTTGRHLHYEIHIDGEPIDPARFLDAGRHLIHVFKG